jgi:hypothetical protein
VANNWSGYLVLAVGALAGAWLWQAPDDPVQVLAALTLALAAVVGIFWHSRAQHARRWRTALDAYAERSLARESRHQPKASASHGA